MRQHFAGHVRENPARLGGPFSVQLRYAADRPDMPQTVPTPATALRATASAISGAQPPQDGLSGTGIC